MNHSPLDIYRDFQRVPIPLQLRVPKYIIIAPGDAKLFHLPQYTEVYELYKMNINLSLFMLLSPEDRAKFILPFCLKNYWKREHGSISCLADILLVNPMGTVSGKQLIEIFKKFTLQHMCGCNIDGEYTVLFILAYLHYIHREIVTLNTWKYDIELSVKKIEDMIRYLESGKCE